jgi:hypothetical protein
VEQVHLSFISRKKEGTTKGEKADSGFYGIQIRRRFFWIFIDFRIFSDFLWIQIQENPLFPP